MNSPNQTVGKNSYPPYPEYPYAPPICGLFHNQTLTNPNVLGTYSVYIPGNFDPCSPGVVILTPNDITAQRFIEDGTGKEWISVADYYGIAVVVAEAYGAKTWNLDNSVEARDDETFLKRLYDKIRDKSPTITAAFDLDERATYLLGYGEGGSAAHKFALLWPQLFCGMVTVGGSAVPDEIIRLYSEKLSYPFAQSGSLEGQMDLFLPNKDIPLPVWIIESKKSADNSELLLNHWITAANASSADHNEYTRQAYEKDAVRVWVTSASTAADINPDTIYSKYLSQVHRFYSEPGGVLEWSVQHTNEDGHGFFFTETEVDGLLRRWLTYIPRTYNEAVEHPLVLAIHGGYSATTSFTGDTHWQDVAEKYGFIVVFPQSYPSSINNFFQSIPVPFWRQYVLVPDSPHDDVAFLKEVIARTKNTYNIDTRRIFSTGHSNGAGMTWRLGLDTPELLSAIAPIGLTLSSYFEDAEPAPLDVPLPTWVFMGRYDGLGADQFEKGSTNDKCLQYWSKRNGFDASILSAKFDDSGRFYIRTWTNGCNNIPLFRFATAKNCPHAYLPSEAELIWVEFFSKITMEEDGKRYFNGQEITRG
jgi:polyhydroxybutyrate depolymerase